MAERRVVLKEAVGEDEVNRLAERSGWVLQGQIEVAEDRPFERIWRTPDGRAALHYIEDWVIGFPYIVVDAAEPDALADEIGGQLDAWSRDDAFAQFDSAGTLEDRAEALYVIALLAPERFDPTTYRFLRAAFDDGDSELRRAAALAAFYTRWSEAEPDLERLTRDPVERVARYASVVIAKLREHHWRTDGP